MPKELSIWREGFEVARVTKTGEHAARIDYSTAGVFPISLSLLNGEKHNETRVFNWLENLLPENEQVKSRIAKVEGVGSDVFSLLGKIGGDVAGSLIIMPVGVSPYIGRPLRIQLGDEDIAEKIYKSKFDRSGSGAAIIPTRGQRLSLAGMQDKFSLQNYMGHWFESNYSTPSTYIFKPGKIEYIEKVENCTLNLASMCGVESAKSIVARFGEKETCFVTERFDRTPITGEGVVRRLHIEDLSQVLGANKDSKYNDGIKFSIKDVFDTLKKYGVADKVLYTFVQQMVFNVLVGNEDAHFKNYSIFLEEGNVRFTPLYDSIAIGPIHTRSPLAMSVNGKFESERINIYDWRDWAVRNGLSADGVSSIVYEMKKRIKGHYRDAYKSFDNPLEVHKYKEILEHIDLCTSGVR